MKRKMNPRSLADLRPPFRKGEVHNPEGMNAGSLGLHRFLDGRIAREIARGIRQAGLTCASEVWPRRTAANHSERNALPTVR